MTTFAFYLSTTPDHDRQLIGLPNGGIAFIRVEQFDNLDDAEALAVADPQPDETLMNTHMLPMVRQ